MTNNIGKMDLGLFVATLTLLGFGIVLVYSSSFVVATDPKYGGSGPDYFFSRQVIRALLAVVCFTFFINIDYHFFSKYSGAIFIVAVVLLVYVLLLPDNHAVNGAKRWITLLGVRFQVSDFARMALILLLAKKCGEDDADFSNWRALVPHYLRIGILCCLVVMEPDFSTTVIILVTAFAMLFMGGAKVRHILGTVALAVPVAVVMVLRTPYRMNRVTGFMNLDAHSGNLGYQVTQSLIGFGRGGLFGAGLGKGEQKHFYLPEPHTDFILSVLGEEFGFIGVMVILLIFAYVIFRGFRISLKAPDRTGQLIAFGFTLVVALYVLVHSCVVTGLVPPTGIPMPFLSYGGMSLIFMMSSMGILLNISSQITDETSPIPVSGRKRQVL